VAGSVSISFSSSKDDDTHLLIDDFQVWRGQATHRRLPKRYLGIRILDFHLLEDLNSSQISDFSVMAFYID
jgi:hypothetical protein